MSNTIFKKITSNPHFLYWSFADFRTVIEHLNISHLTLPLPIAGVAPYGRPGPPADDHLPQLRRGGRPARSAAALAGIPLRLRPRGGKRYWWALRWRWGRRDGLCIVLSEIHNAKAKRIAPSSIVLKFHHMIKIIISFKLLSFYLIGGVQCAFLKTQANSNFADACLLLIV